MARKGDGLQQRGKIWYLDARINAIVLFFIVCGTSSTAFAECAWVVWIKIDLISVISTKLDQEIRWEAHSSFEKRAQCLDKQEFLWKETEKDAESNPTWKNIRKEFPEKIYAERPGGTWVKTFYCLPDSVDPRGK
jgi:hypothetical protein